jgi:hypothetical protein
MMEERPPFCDPTNKKSIFEFYIWHVKRMFQPDKIEVQPLTGSTSNIPRQDKPSKIIYEDAKNNVYYFQSGQINCEFNIE